MLMKTADATQSDAAGARFTVPLTPARRDGFGERWLSTDTTDSAPVELLRFRDEVASAPGFEEALRERVAELADFKDLTFPAVRDIIKDGDQLTLVSERADGQSLAELSASAMPKAMRPAFVARLLRETIAALAALEGVEAGVTHSALTADRILVTPEGRVRVTEHTLAPALEQLALWPEDLWSEFGLLAPPNADGEALFDRRTTLMQLGALALGALLARPVSHSDFEHRLAALLDEFTASASGSLLAVPLRRWLERALQLTADAYLTAGEADLALKRLISGAGPAAGVEVNTVPFPWRAGARAKKPAGEDRTRSTEPADVPTDDEASEPAVAAPGTPAAPTVDIPADPEARPWRRPDAGVVVEDVPVVARSSRAVSPWQRPEYLLWAAIALGVVAVGEGIALTRLLISPPTVVVADSSVVIESPQAGDTVLVDGKPAGATPLAVHVNPQVRSIRLVPAPVTPPPPTETSTAKVEETGAAAALEQAAARQRSGGVSIKTPIELKVLEGDRVLGSTADGPIVASAGTHQLDLVNSALGYRARQTVTIRAGVITPITITPPMGHISINAQPWAQVLIDDNAVGETPLANVPATIGDHQITFRHPQLGERRERVTVRADVPARVSTTFQQR